eukprot:7702154-Pyramimonas_sp.AAC.1
MCCPVCWAASRDPPRAPGRERRPRYYNGLRLPQVVVPHVGAWGCSFSQRGSSCLAVGCQ